MTRVALSIGSNLGDCVFFMNSMVQLLRYVLEDMSVSELMETEPVGVDGPQPPYLNRIVVGDCAYTPRQLLGACRRIEFILGRTRESPRGPRTADIDILLFGDLLVNEADSPLPLIIPHPELRNRRFCLYGLARIDPGIVVPAPGAGLTVGELYENMGADVAAQNVFSIVDGEDC